MKKLNTLVIISLSITLAGSAQSAINDSIRISRLSSKVIELEEKISTLLNEQSKMNEQVRFQQKAIADSINRQSTLINSLIPELNITGEKVKALEYSQKRNDQEIWDRTSKNLVYLPTVLKAMNSRINIIYSTISNQQKNELMLEITNPQSGVLGFKMGDKILEMLEKDIFAKNAPKTGKKKDLDDYKEKTQQIFNVVDMVTKSPILTSIPGIGSALSMTNMVTGFLRNVSFMSNSISQQDITSFENSINKYITFYNSLNENQVQNAYANAQLELQLLALQEQFYSYTVTASQVTGFKFSGKPESYASGSAFYTAFIGEYELFTQSYFGKLKPFDESGAFTAEAKKLNALNEDLEKMLDFYDSIEKMHKNYAENEKINATQTENTLQMAVNGGIATKKNIDTAVKRLQKVTETSLQNFSIAVNLPGLVLDVKRIMYKY